MKYQDDFSNKANYLQCKQRAIDEDSGFFGLTNVKTMKDTNGNIR